MPNQHSSDFDLPDPSEIAETMSAISQKSQELVQHFFDNQKDIAGLEDPDPLQIGQAFWEMSQRFWSNPNKAMELQRELWEGYATLWHKATMSFLGQEIAKPLDKQDGEQRGKGDRRFKDDAWQENPFFDFIKQSYLLTAETVHNAVSSVEGMDKQDAQKVEFYTRQFLDALSPSNFILTNPEILKATQESGGKNLVQGLENLLQDLERGRIRMTDESAFELGKNIATTPGSVVYQNELMQLIQYAPSTEEVHRRPLLIIPPWINKYYILDLQEKNSFVKWAVAQGFTVFILSWVNPDEKLADKSFEDYMTLGPLAALDAIEKATGEREVNAIGYCLGGTLLSCTLAYMAEKKDDRIKSGTFFVTMTDFSEPGELSVFIDDAQLKALEKRMEERGYLDGAEMGTTFSMLRSNDLIWSFVVNNYLLGKTPFPFDLLYWNSDTTRMPARMHSFYLRRMYLENKLAEPGGITLCDTPIDLRKVEVPSFMISAKEDHIAPWKATYANTQLFSGKKEFVLAASGHIAGIINPPQANKYTHWTNDKTPADPEEWFAEAKEHPGSWWPKWARWAKQRSGKMVPARKPEDGKLPIIEAAPGSYVKVR